MVAIVETQEHTVVHRAVTMAVEEPGLARSKPSSVTSKTRAASPVKRCPCSFQGVESDPSIASHAGQEAPALGGGQAAPTTGGKARKHHARTSLVRKPKLLSHCCAMLLYAVRIHVGQGRCCYRSTTSGRSLVQQRGPCHISMPHRSLCACAPGVHEGITHAHTQHAKQIHKL